MPWQKYYDETEVLERAMKAFWARGYEATSMGDLVRETGINRGSIYAAFHSKHALFMDALRHYDRIYRDQHLQQIARNHSPREAILAVFKSAVGKPDDPDIPRGCLVVNTALELSPHDPEVSAFVDKSLRCVEEFFHARIESAREAGEVDADLDARSTAQALLSLFLGLRVLTRARTRKATTNAVISQAEIMLR